MITCNSSNLNQTLNVNKNCFNITNIFLTRINFEANRNVFFLKTKNPTNKTRQTFLNSICFVECLHNNKHSCTFIMLLYHMNLSSQMTYFQYKTVL